MRDYRDFIKFRINEYSKEVGIPIDGCLLRKFEDYFPFIDQRIDLTISLYISKGVEKSTFYNFDISYPISNTRGHQLSIRYIDYLSYLRDIKIESIFSDTQTISKKSI